MIRLRLIDSIVLWYSDSIVPLDTTKLNQRPMPTMLQADIVPEEVKKQTK